MTHVSTPRIAIIGGGLTGLAAAQRLQEVAREHRAEPIVTVLEASPRLGGLVGTISRDGYLIDTGADSFITNKPGALQLCQRLGLNDRLQATDPTYRGALVLHEGQPVPVPEGFQLLSPTALWPMLTTPLLSPWGKVRMAWEYLVPRLPQETDESLAQFVRRRFGAEVLDRLVQPLVGGIYTSDPERLSLAATMPRFQDMERKHGSLIRAALTPTPAKGQEDRSSSGARYGLFAGLQGGMQELVDTLVKRVSAGCTVGTGQAVQEIHTFKDGDGSQRYRLLFADGHSEEFDGVILTTAAYRAAKLVSAIDLELSRTLGEIEYASSAIVVTGHALARIAHPLNSFGLVIPHRERRRILAVSFSSRKFPNRAPAGRVLLRTFVGGAMQPEFNALDDEALVRLVREELKDLLGVAGAPDFAMVVRYPQAMPQFTIGHLDRVQSIEQRLSQHPGLEVAGNAYHGVGVPDAIHSGERAADRLLNVLCTTPTLTPALTQSGAGRVPRVETQPVLT